MQIKNLAPFFALASSLACTSTLAQTRYCIGGDLDHLSSSQRASCNARLQEVRALATTMHAPADWHFIVVCGEQGWQDYVHFNAGDKAEGLLQASADTRVEEHETYLRESKLGQNASAAQQLLAQQIAQVVQQTAPRQASGTHIQQTEFEAAKRGF